MGIRWDINAGNMPNNMTLRCVIEKNVTTMSSDFGWSKGDPKIWCKKTLMYMEYYGSISCDFLWFLDIYCDLVWFHENSWVYSSLHVNFDNRNITSQKNWVWCVSTNLKMAKKIFLIVMLVINHQIQWGGTISSDKPTWMLKVGPSSLVAPKNDAKTGWIDLERDTSDFWLYIYNICWRSYITDLWQPASTLVCYTPSTVVESCGVSTQQTKEMTSGVNLPQWWTQPVGGITTRITIAN